MTENRHPNSDGSLPRLLSGAGGRLPDRVAAELIDFGARTAGLGAWEYDFDRHEVYWTPGVFDIFDLEADKPPLYDEAIRYFVPEDRERIAAGVRTAIDEGIETDIVCRVVSAKKRSKFVRLVIRPETSEANGSRLKGIVQDVTGREVLQRGMETFFGMTPDLVGALNVEGRPLNLSPSWESVLGWSSAEIRKRGILGLVHEAERGQMRKLMSEVLGAEVIHHIETRLQTVEGDFRWFSWRLFGDDASKTIFVAARDVSRRKQNEAALMEAKRQAEEASMAKSEFLAVMSHELRTPLNPILGFTDLLIDETDNPEHKEILAAISEAGQNLTKVIGDVLDFAKIESGRTEVHQEEFDIEKLLDAKVRLMRGQLDGDGVDLRLRFERSEAYSADTRFVGDPEKISRVLTNLIGNAIKFTLKGSIEVRASVGPTDNGALLEIAVEDSGDGISSDKLDSIFEPFVQVDSSITRQHGGSGLGLSICKKLVELMGGRISVESRRGMGSTFSYCVPLRPVEVREAAASPEGFNVKAWADELRERGAPHVLLVEDNPTNAYYAKRILENFHCQVTAVTSGEEALTEYSAGTHDLILLDLHMPGIGGMEVLRSIRKSEATLGWRRVPILVLTADVMKATRNESLTNGADAVLNKPIRAQGLAEALAAHF